MRYDENGHIVGRNGQVLDPALVTLVAIQCGACWWVIEAHWRDETGRLCRVPVDDTENREWAGTFPLGI